MTLVHYSLTYNFLIIFTYSVFLYHLERNPIDIFDRFIYRSVSPYHVQILMSQKPAGKLDYRCEYYGLRKM